jgi:hypothetical protein
MAVKALFTQPKLKHIKVEENIEGRKTFVTEKEIQKFISQGGSLATPMSMENDDDHHRLTLRIPKHLIDKIDTKRKQRIGTISRNLWILELIDKATQK